MIYIHNFREISDTLSCSGQPTEEQLKELAAQQYQVIVNLGLSDTKYSLPDEAASVKQSGMDYCHIPVLFDNPQISDLAAFIQSMDKKTGKKILVHCAANYRASCFTALYLYYITEMTEDEIIDMIGDVWQPDHIWQSFLEEGIAYIDTIRN
jgi:protein tyrosine phosphatase (PTP) superfamily phosphohydrolase (DUF442 family)